MTSRYTFDNYYAHKGNRVALLAAKKIVDFPGEIFNPFYVYGVEGSGKTHLLNALNDELSKKFATNFLPVRDFERGLEEERIFDSPLIVDDVHTIRDDYKERLELFVERAVSADIQVCFAADVAPQQIKDFSPRLCSLIESGLVSELSLPELSDRIYIIKKKAEGSGIIIPDDFAEALAQMVTGSVNMINKVVSRIVTYASLGNLPTDIDSVRSLLSEFYPKGKACSVPTVLDKIRRNDLFELRSSDSNDLRTEYDEKTHIWELKGLDVSLLKECGSCDEVQLRNTYHDYVQRVRRLFELQEILHDRKEELDNAEAVEIESMIFDPQKIAQIEELLHATARTPETFGGLDSFIVGDCNREAYQTIHDEVLGKLGANNPCFIVGAKGTGKTYLLQAICDELVSHDKHVVFVDLRDSSIDTDWKDTDKYDALVLDNLEAVFFETGKVAEIFSVVDACVGTHKQIFASVAPPLGDLPEAIKDLLDTGLVVELASLSADVVREYIRKNMPREAPGIIEQLPDFNSYYELDSFLQRSGEGESVVVSLGLPGEEIPEEVEAYDSVKSAEPVGPAPSMVTAKPKPVDISGEQNFMIPDVQAELIEENF
jgi:chromosomal replication initiation ATPase DnaA